MVVDAAGIERFPLLGISQGCAITAAYAARHPERVSQLILYGGFAVGNYKSDSPDARERAKAMRSVWDGGRTIWHFDRCIRSYSSPARLKNRWISSMNCSAGPPLPR